MSEHDEQAALFQWCALQARAIPELKLLFAIPNGGHRHKAVAQKMRAEGVKSGVPDICLPIARNGHHGLFIEMKFGNNKPSSNQRQWIADLQGQGYRVEVCWNWDDARLVLLEYLGVENGT